MQDFRNPQLTTTARARCFIGTAAEDAFELRPGGEMLDTPRSSDPFLIAQRGTPRRASDSRDRFAELRAELRGKARQGDPYALRGSAETEVHRYDQPDSVLDFDYHMERFRLVLQRELAAGLTFSLGPQAELLSAPWTPAERYTELGGAAEFELLSRSHWWSCEPGAGRRTYTSLESGGTTDPAQDSRGFYFSLDLRRLF